MDKIELRKAKELKPHPLNVELFGDPKKSPEYEEIRDSIREIGIQEPLLVLADGTIVSGHLRWTAQQDIAADRVFQKTKSRSESTRAKEEAEVPTRLHPGFESKADEYDYVLNSNFKRRPFTLEVQVRGLDLIKQKLGEGKQAEAPQKKKGGRPRKDATKRGAKPKSREQVLLEKYAAKMGVISEFLEAASDMFKSPILPPEYLQQLKDKTVSVEVLQKALQYAVNRAGREGRPPTMEEVRAYLENPEPVKKRKVSSLLERVVQEVSLEPAKPPEPPPKAANRFALLRQEFDTALREVNLDPETKEELSALYSLLHAFLSRLDLIPKEQAASSSVGLPESLEGKLAFFTSVVESVGEVEDPEAIRDLLLTLSLAAKNSVGRLTQTQRTLEPNGLLCSICHEPQYRTPHGDTCMTGGHGGAPGVTPASLQPKDQAPGSEDSKEIDIDKLFATNTDFTQAEDTVAFPTLPDDDFDPRSIEDI